MAPWHSGSRRLLLRACSVQLAGLLHPLLPSPQFWLVDTLQRTCPHIRRSLSLAHSPQLTDAGLLLFAERGSSSSGLEELNLTECTGLGEQVHVVTVLVLEDMPVACCLLPMCPCATICMLCCHLRGASPCNDRRITWCAVWDLVM